MEFKIKILLLLHRNSWINHLIIYGKWTFCLNEWDVQCFVSCDFMLLTIFNSIFVLTDYIYVWPTSKGFWRSFGFFFFTTWRGVVFLLFASKGPCYFIIQKLLVKRTLQIRLKLFELSLQLPLMNYANILVNRNQSTRNGELFMFLY